VRGSYSTYLTMSFVLTDHQLVCPQSYPQTYPHACPQGYKQSYAQAKLLFNLKSRTLSTPFFQLCPQKNIQVLHPNAR
jgi:hypothetical protein